MWDWLQKIVHNFFPPQTFSRYVAISTLVHLGIFLCFAFSFRVSKRSIPQIDPTKVVWTQTVKQKKPTPENKLPPPDVAREKPKVEEEKKVNVEKKKEEPKKKPEVDRKKLLEEALSKVKNQIDDDRPTPKDDNFASGETTPTPPLLSSDQVASMKASPEMFAYTEAIHALVVNNFLWYQSEKNFITKIEIRLAASGDIEKTTILQSSGNQSFDQATLRAIQKSSPLPQPPDTLAPLFNQETIVFIFDGSQL